MKEHWTNDHWYDFLDDLSSNSGRYVPVVGSELMVYQEAGKRISVHQKLAKRLAAKLRVDTKELSEPFGLIEVIRTYQLRRKDFVSAKPYSSIVEILNEEKWPIPEPVRKLASIRHFNFFLNASWLPFLKLALEQERQFPVFEASNIVGKPMQDFDDESIGVGLCVFNLFGSASASSSANSNTFSVTDDDLLECMHRLLSNPPSRTSAHLLEKNRELLVWGCSFSSWLARFFLYSLVRTVPLQAGQARRMRVVADGRCTGDDSLQAFWTSLNAPIYDGESAVDFIDELFERWHKEFPAVPDPLADAPQSILLDHNPFSTGEIFISYARKDAEAAKEIAACLRNNGLSVWLDLDCLQNGDLYRAKIRSNIQYCSCFIPLISSEAIGNVVELGFMYKEEWLFAKEQAELRRDGGMALSEFILPVCIDPSIDLYDPRLPDFIRERHIESWADGPPSSWTGRVREARKQFARAKKGQPRKEQQ